MIIRYATILQMLLLTSKSLRLPLNHSGYLKVARAALEPATIEIREWKRPPGMLCLEQRRGLMYVRCCFRCAAFLSINSENSMH